MLINYFCPYCGDKNNIKVEYPDGLHIVVCSHSLGGCDQVFVVHLHSDTKIIFYELKEISNKSK